MKENILIGAYHLQKNARDEEHIKDIKDCGIDFIIGMEKDTAALDLFEKYGLGAIVSGAVPGWWGGFGENCGKLRDTNPLSKYEEYAARFVDHPAITGLCIGDEPSVLDLPYFGEVVEKMKELFPDKLPYLNLYPGYGVEFDTRRDFTAAEKQIGVSDFSEYFAEYCKSVPLPYLSFDHYVYSSCRECFESDLSSASWACREYDRELWVVLQVNSKEPNVCLSENMLRYQAFTAMAYGADRITWACCSGGWWHNNLLDPEGRWTEQYEKLKRVNREIKRIGERYVNYRNKATTVSFFGVPVNCTAFKSVTTGDHAVIGDMVSRTDPNAYAMLICPAEDIYDNSPKVHEVSFRTDGLENIAVIGGEGIIPYRKHTDGTYTFPLESSHGALVVGNR